MAFSFEEIEEEFACFEAKADLTNHGYRFFRPYVCVPRAVVPKKERAKRYQAYRTEWGRKKKARIYADPVKHEAFKARDREYWRLHRAKNKKPPKPRKPATPRSLILKKRYERVKADPVKLARRRQVARESYHRCRDRKEK